MGHKILHVFDHSIPLHSGYTFRSKAILNVQRALGLDTYHLTSPKHYFSSKSEATHETVDNLKFVRTMPSNCFFSKIPFLSQIQDIKDTQNRLEQYIAEVRPDILHAHSPALNGVAVVRAAKKFNLPVVYEIRAFWEDAAVDNGSTKMNSIRYKLTRNMETWVVRRASYVITICQGLKSDLLGRGIAKNKIGIVGNGVDSELINAPMPDSTNAFKEKLNIKSKYVLGFIGSFYAYEGLRLLVEATKLLLDNQHDVSLLLIGGGEEEARLQQQVSDLGLREKVIFTGRVPHNEVVDYFALIDFIVCPRLDTRLTETVTPMKPLEAMARRSIAVVSDVGGHRELVKHEETGYLFPANDAQALYQCLISIIGDDEKNELILNNAEEFIHQERTWKVIGEKYLEIYKNL